MTTADVDRVWRAWNDPGPVPEVHRAAQDRLRRDWPALAGALDALPRPEATP
jgi:hypothetical protein